jgi:hypothetical protein
MRTWQIHALSCFSGGICLGLVGTIPGFSSMKMTLCPFFLLEEFAEGRLLVAARQVGVVWRRRDSVRLRYEDGGVGGRTVPLLPPASAAGRLRTCRTPGSRTKFDKNSQIF